MRFFNIVHTAKRFLIADECIQFSYGYTESAELRDAIVRSDSWPNCLGMPP